MTSLRTVAVVLALSAAFSAQGALAQEAAPPATSDTTSGAGIPDILVTATKQSESLQKAPVAITAITGDSLVQAGVVDIRGVEQFVPSVRLQTENQAVEVYVRGVGLTLDLPEVDPPVSINFNGVYIPREATGVPIYDVSQVEVLPGPQGTLYGRSSLGGVVNVNYNRPTFEYETHAVLEAGNYDMIHGTLVQNIPLSDKFAVRIAGDYHKHDGYNGRSGSADDWSLRLSTLWKPVDTLSVYLWGTVNGKNGIPPASVTKGINPNTLALEPGRYLNDDPFNEDYPSQFEGQLFYGQPSSFVRRISTYNNTILGGQIDWELAPDLTLTYIPSYLDFKLIDDYNIAASPARQSYIFKQTTHELRLSGKTSWGSFLGGIYGYRMRSGGFANIGLLTGPEQTDPFVIRYINTQRNVIKGIAAFGQVTVDLMDDLHLTVGGRYGIDNREGLGYPGSAGFPAGELGQYTFEKTYRRFDYKAGISYDLTPKIMLYAQIQTGYQPGTFNEFRNNPVDAQFPDGNPNITNEVKPANLTAYTAGFKSRLFDGVVQINNEFFYYDYRNLFVGTFSTNLGLTQLFNASKVEIYGDQLDIVVQPTKDDRLTFSVGYLHARNKDFSIPDTIPSGTGQRNFDGLALQYAPDWTINAGYSHDFQIAGDGGYIRASVYTHYESSFFADFFQTPGTRQKAYTKSDASLTYYSGDGKWSIGAWIKNIENEPVIAAAASGSSVPFNPLAAVTFLQAPRTWGFRATLDF